MPAARFFSTRLRLALVALTAGFACPMAAQETAEPPASEESPEAPPFAAPSPPGTDGIPIPLEISRRSLPNFLVDEIATIPHTSPDGVVRNFSEAFMIGSPSARYVAIWDPVSCRLVGTLDLEAPKEASAPKTAPAEARDENESSTAPAENSPDESDEPPSSPYVLLAAGPAPLLASPGGFGTPEFFGLRLENGRPEFLYIFGSLLVEEQIWFENDGNVLMQRFALREPAADLVLTLPETWVERGTSGHGSWSKNTLTVPQAEAEAVVLAYRLAPETEEAETDSPSQTEPAP